jgi:hypothetical protein
MSHGPLLTVKGMDLPAISHAQLNVVARKLNANAVPTWNCATDSDAVAAWGLRPERRLLEDRMPCPQTPEAGSIAWGGGKPKMDTVEYQRAELHTAGNCQPGSGAAAVARLGPLIAP